MDPGSASDDVLEITVRSAAEIAGRMLALLALVHRGLVEAALDADDDSDAGADEEVFDILAMVELSGAGQHLSRQEAERLEARPGMITEEDAFDLAWQSEALAMLLAATGVIDRLAPVELTDARLLESVTENWGSNTVDVVAKSLHLPADEDAANLREAQELWLWRVMTEQELRAASDDDREELLSLIREVAAEGHDAGLLAIDENGDFSSSARSITSLPLEELAVLHVANEVRLKAMNWLCGLGDDWATVPLDV